MGGKCETEVQMTVACQFERRRAEVKSVRSIIRVVSSNKREKPEAKGRIGRQ